MAARNEREALREIGDRLQQSISCVSPAVVNYVPVAPALYDIAAYGGGPDRRFVRLSSNSNLTFVERYRVVRLLDQRAWTATIVAYRYGLSDRDGREILSYHWHPDGRSHVTTPHLHLGGGVTAWRLDLSKAHIPTGHVTLEAVLLLAIEELALDMVPLRADWRDILRRTTSSDAS